MPTPSWTYNRLMRNINDIQTVMTALDESSEEYKKLQKVSQSLTGLAVVIRKDQKK